MWCPIDVSLGHRLDIGHGPDPGPGRGRNLGSRLTVGYLPILCLGTSAAEARCVVGLIAAAGEGGLLVT